MSAPNILDMLLPHRVSIKLRWQLPAYLWCAEFAVGRFNIVEGGVTDAITWAQLRDEQVVFGFSDENVAFAFKMRWG